MKRLFAILAGSLSLNTACRPIPAPPSQPILYNVACVVSDISTYVPISGAVCGIGNQLAVTNQDGYALLGGIPAGNIELHVDKAPDYQHIVLHVSIGGNMDVPVALAPVQPNTGEPHVKLTADDSVFRRPDGSIFRWLGASDFSLYAKLLNGEDLHAVLADRVRLGFTVVRVFGMVDSFTRLYPQEYSNYYDRLADLARLVGDYGLRLEFVVFADAQIIMPSAVDERVHIEKVVEALKEEWNVFVETGNECYKNLPGGDDACRTLAGTVRNRGLLVAVGSVETGPFPPAAQIDYGTHHTARDTEWPRKAKDIFDVQQVTHVPFVADEPIGAAEIDRPGSRTASAIDYRFYCGNAALFGGVTFHSDQGVMSNVLSGNQRTLAQACVQGATFVPAEAPIWSYQRGDQGSEAGIGNMPILHNDAIELRSYCKGNNEHEYCIQTRTIRDHATSRDGWRVVSEPWQGFVALEKP